MTSLTDNEVKYLVSMFLLEYKRSIKNAVVFLAPLAKAKINNTMSSTQANYLLATCKDKIKVLHTMGLLNAWAIDIYSERVEASGFLARAA